MTSKNPDSRPKSACHCTRVAPEGRQEGDPDRMLKPMMQKPRRAPLRELQAALDEVAKRKRDAWVLNAIDIMRRM